MTVQKIEWVHFHPVGSQCIKILLITNYKKIKTFSTLKNSVHVEPVWFSLDSLTLCAALTTAQWYCARLKQISDALKLFSCERDDFLLFSSNIETSCQQNKKSSDKLEIPCGTKFLRVLIFTIFAIFPAIRNNNPPPPPFKINENTFPAKIYSRVLNILWLKYTTQKYSTKKSCLFNYNSPLQFRNKTVYNELVLHSARIP